MPRRRKTPKLDQSTAKVESRRPMTYKVNESASSVTRKGSIPNSPRAHLFTLPPEIRLLIYTYTCADVGRNQENLDFLLTSRLINQEARNIAWQSINHFTITASSSKLKSVPKLLNGWQRASISSILHVSPDRIDMVSQILAGHGILPKTHIIKVGNPEVLPPVMYRANANSPAITPPRQVEYQLRWRMNLIDLVRDNTALENIVFTVEPLRDLDPLKRKQQDDVCHRIWEQVNLLMLYQHDLAGEGYLGQFGMHSYYKADTECTDKFANDVAPDFPGELTYFRAMTGVHNLARTRKLPSTGDDAPAERKIHFLRRIGERYHPQAIEIFVKMERPFREPDRAAWWKKSQPVSAPELTQKLLAVKHGVDSDYVLGSE